MQKRAVFFAKKARTLEQNIRFEEGAAKQQKRAVFFAKKARKLEQNIDF